MALQLKFEEKSGFPLMRTVNLCQLLESRVAVRVIRKPTWRQPGGKSSVNLSQMLPPGGSSLMGK